MPGGGEEEKREKKFCCISHHFVHSASENPAHIAVVHAAGGLRALRDSPSELTSHPSVSSSHPPLFPGDECFTFADLASAVDSLSCRIRRALDGGDDPDLVRPSDFNRGDETPMSSYSSDGTPCIVGVYIDPSVDYIVAVLSILKCGEAFLPLDSSWPEERILSILSSSRASLVIQHRRQSDAADWILNRGGCSVLYTSMRDAFQENSGQFSLDWPCKSSNPRKFCYLMYTSGSTGKPKGVCGTEKGLLNRFWWMQEQFPLCTKDVLFFKTPISFVDHLQEFLGAILTCTALIVPPFDELKIYPTFMVNVLQAYRISRLTAVPSLMRAILPSLESLDWKQIRWTLKVLVLSGEILSLSLWKVLHELLPETTILNLYGSTEVSNCYCFQVSGDCTYFNCERLSEISNIESPSSVPIGTPISNCEILLVGEPDTPDEGEIYVRGACLMTGYFGEPFSGHPVQNGGSTLHFRTGDFARRLQSGDLIFVGRKDRTVKVRGQRVALEEIENTLREHPEVSDAAVTFCKTNGCPSHLEAYFMTKVTDRCQKHHIDQHVVEELIMSVRSWLVRKLPPAMIPSHYICTRLLPKFASGKIDYAALSSSNYVAKRLRSEYERNHSFDNYLQIIKEAFCDALLVKEVSDYDDFFMMGGNSISAAHAAHKLGIDMRILYIFPSPFKLLNALLDKKTSQENFFSPSLDSGKRLKVHDNMSSFFDASKINLQNSRLFGGLQENNGERSDNLSARLNVTHPMGQFEKTDSSPFNVAYLKDTFLSLASNDTVSIDGGIWISNIDLPETCSFSRCNQFMHDGKVELTYVHQPCLSVEIPRYRNGCLQKLWKVPLKSCVDASPLVVLKDGNVNLFIGSHSHTFLCIDAFRGFVRWEVTLEGRIECSATITGDFYQVVVGCYKGKIYFLDFMTGEIAWTFQTDGEVKMQPVVDKLRNLIWCGSHDHCLYALDYKKHCCVYKFSCGGSVYGAPSIDMVRNMIYVASTSGRISGISVEVLPFNMVWLYESGVPIFGSLSLDSINGNVISCLVDGRVIALNSRGDVIWKATVGGPIFAGGCISSALPSQVLICSRNGGVYSFDTEGGALLWEHQIGDPITASPYVDEQSCLISEPSLPCDRLACVCGSSGSIHVLRIISNTKQERSQAPGVSEIPMVQEFATMDLPGDIFSSPVMIGGRIFVGCRDDNVHCINVS